MAETTQNSTWDSLKGFFGYNGNGGLVAKPDYLAPLNRTTCMIAGTNIHLNGDGTYTKFASRGQDITGSVSDLTGIGADTTIIGADGKSYGINPANNTFNWQQGLGYGLAGLQTLTGLANAYLGYKNYKLAKDQFGFEKAAVNRNIANQAKQINSAYDSSASIAAAMQGTDANGVLRPEVRERYMNEAKNRHVDGSKIG